MIAISAATGRADLLRAWVEGGEVGLAAMARLLSYEERSTGLAPLMMPEDKQAIPSGSLSTHPIQRPRSADLAPVPFWRLERVEHLEPKPPPPPPTGVAPILRAQELGLRPGVPPPQLELVSEARLWAALRRRLGSSTPSRQVDVPRLAERWSRCERVERVPFRSLPAWAQPLMVLIDQSPRLIPFYADQRRLLHQLRARLGRGALREVVFLSGAERPWREGRRRYHEVPLAPGGYVLALSDLEYFSPEPRRALWSPVAERLRRGGATLTALVPSPAERWQGDLAVAWNAVSWERPERLGAARRPLSDSQRLDRAERLLGLVSFAASVEPALLRAVRRLLPAQQADAGTEADAWNHPQVASGFAPAASLRPELRRRLHARFQGEPEALKRRVVEVLRFHRSGAPAEVWLDEVLGLSASHALPPGTLLAEEITAAETLWRRMGTTLTGEGAPAQWMRAVRGFVSRSGRDRIPEAAWSDPILGPILWRAWTAAWEGAGTPPLPPGLGPDLIDPIDGEPRRWHVRQVGSKLNFSPSDSREGGTLVDLESVNGQVSLRQEGIYWSQASPLGEDAPLPNVSTLLLLTDRTRATLRRVHRPEWASALGRDRFGLWATLEVEGVEQRLRWIPPGRFWMGSPEDEPGRYDDEGPRHLKVIKDGFWLGETPCTQALWQAVMGDNPSQFQGSDRPVEQVSWEDCRRFLKKLGGQDADGECWRLPLEAEWEYACRAGTETATYAGPIEMVEDFKAPVLNAIAWYGGNSGEPLELVDGEVSGLEKEARDRVDEDRRRQGEDVPSNRTGTHPVGRKDPNPWGLYDTLGNVFEWCEDLWRRSYDRKPDPEGSDRVIRGGSWNSDARFCRAAFRIRNVPSFRWYNLGFRLARGQSALQSGAEPGGAERPDRGVARRGTRPPASGPRKS